MCNNATEGLEGKRLSQFLFAYLKSRLAELGLLLDEQLPDEGSKQLTQPFFKGDVKLSMPCLGAVYTVGLN